MSMPLRNRQAARFRRAVERAERVERALSRKALVAPVVWQRRSVRPASNLAAQLLTLGVMLEVREPAGRFLVVAARMRRHLDESEWAKLDDYSREEIGPDRSPARMAMRWLLSDDAVMDGRPDLWSLVRASGSEPLWPVRIDQPRPLPAPIRRKLAQSTCLTDFCKLVEDAALAEYLKRTTESAVGFFSVFPDLS